MTVSMTRSLYKSVEPDLPIGGALSFGVSYVYDRINLSLQRTTFSPEEDHQFFEDKDNKRFITLNVGARF